MPSAAAATALSSTALTLSAAAYNLAFTTASISVATTTFTLATAALSLSAAAYSLAFTTASIALAPPTLPVATAAITASDTPTAHSARHRQWQPSARPLDCRDTCHAIRCLPLWHSWHRGGQRGRVCRQYHRELRGCGSGG